MKLFIRRYGQGFPVIILHGLLGNSDNWVSFSRNLAAEFDVIVPDIRNHGHSPHSRIFTFQSIVQDVMELMDDLELKQCHIIGHSMGGKAAMMLALENPDLVRKLVVVDISPAKYPGNREHESLIRAMLSVDLSKTASRSDLEHQLEKSVSSGKLRQFLLKNAYWRDEKTLDWRPDLESIRENLPQMFEGIEGNSSFEGPVLFVRGGLSDYIRDEDIPDIKKKFPRAIVQTFANASHWVHADVPGEFFDLVSNFLEKDQ